MTGSEALELKGSLFLFTAGFVSTTVGREARVILSSPSGGLPPVVFDETAAFLITCLGESLMDDVPGMFMSRLGKP